MSNEDFEKYEKISDAIHTLVEDALKECTAESEEDIRDKLTAEFRFWKRVE